MWHSYHAAPAAPRKQIKAKALAGSMLTRAEHDKKDAEIARKGREAWLSGKTKTIAMEEARRRWGV